LVYTESVVSTVKERLTGALILIVALVIIVPELFSGRPEQRAPSVAPDAQSADAGPPLRSYTMDLGAGQTPAKAPEPVAAAAPPAQAVPAPASPAPESPAAPPVTKSPASTPESGKPPAVAAAPKPATNPVASAHGWWVQLGSFAARANADRLATSLGSAGYSVRVSPSTKNGKELFRVLAGPAEDRAAAVALQTHLSAAGHKGTLVAP
jgi:cell division protein FtsN